MQYAMDRLLETAMTAPQLRRVRYIVHQQSVDPDLAYDCCLATSLTSFAARQCVSFEGWHWSCVDSIERLVGRLAETKDTLGMTRSDVLLHRNAIASC